jgi:hypothetical protein
MSFKVGNLKITFLSLENKTVKDLKIEVSKYYKVETSKFDILDLGRILSEEESLEDTERSTFTILLN